jgi:Zn finger protein HypA/HybF involved in hydrogenase expression
MASLLNRYTEYNDRLKAKGAKLIKFGCPACAKDIETLPAPKDEYWDTLAQCPHCEALYMKITEGNTARGEIPQDTAA